MGYKLIRMVQLTQLIVVEVITLTVTMMVNVTWFGPNEGVGRGVCAVFSRTPRT